MQVCQLRPAGPLAEVVDRIWSWTSAPGETVALPLLLPGTGAELVFHYGMPFALDGEGRLPQAHLLCRRRAAQRMVPQAVGFISVRVRAGQMARLLPMPVHEVFDQAVPLSELWGPAVADLLDRLAQARTFAERALQVQAFLLTRLRAGDALCEWAAERLYRQPAGTRIQQLADRAGLGRRQFEKRFSAAMGMPPVRFRRLARFQQVAKHLHLAPATRDLQVALDAGYFDQPHFIREFRDVVGMTPQTYRRQSTGRTHFYNPSWHTEGSMATVT